jgi:flagellar biosynthesis/type III secretory pathway protein FliH
MNGFGKALCIMAAIALLISTSVAIVEHVKQETVERMKEKPPLQLGGGAEEAPENISTDLDRQLDGIISVQPYPGFKSSISGQGDESREPSLLVEPSDYDAIFERAYQEGYQAGYKQGCTDAYQWMISQLQEQMAGITLEGPKIKQAVDALTPHVGELE